MFWADRIVSEIINTRQAPYRVFDWWTPSGLAHAGHIRTLLFHQTIYRGLRLADKDAEFHYGLDDFDPMDGLPPELPEEYRQYMGLPLINIPSPSDPEKTFADYYATKYLQAMEDLDIHPQIHSSAQMYRSGVYNSAIATVLDNADKIRAIYADFGAERPADWYPFHPICQNCGKIGTTEVYDWNGSEVSYRCRKDLVEWTEGCGFEGKISPFDGNGKMPWKVEWPAKWFIFGYDFEGGGKDHFTKGSSRDYGIRLIREVFDAEPPVGYGHELFLIGGKKMSSSKGLGMSANDVAHILPAELIRFFVARTPFNRQIEFSFDGDSIPKIYDEYDRAILAPHDHDESNEVRALEYAHQSTESLPEYVLRFGKVTFLIQMPHVDLIDFAQNEKGSSLTEADKRELAIRSEYARRWLATYADESAKFILQPELPDVVLETNQKIYLARVADEIETTDWTGESLHSLLHAIKNELEIPAKVAFVAIYRIFLNRDDGPQAGWLLASLDKEFVVNRIKTATSDIE